MMVGKEPKPRGLRNGDGVADAAEGAVAAIAAAGGDDEVVVAAGDWVAEDVLRQGVNANWRQYSI